MKGELTIERIIAFLKADLTFACCWPLPTDATKCQRIWDKVFRCLCCLNATTMMVALWYTLFTKYSNMLLVMKVGCELIACIQVPMQIILYTIEHDRLLVIIGEMETFIQKAQQEERLIFRQYIDKVKLFYGVTLTWITITLVCMNFGPLLLPQPFPLEVYYPFQVEKQPLKTIVYLHHILTVYQSYVQVCANVFVGLLLWFVAARFEILSGKFRKVTSLSEFVRCIRLHQQLLKYARDVTTSVRYLVVTSVGISTIAVIFSGLTCLSRQPLTIKAQFITIGFSALIEVFVCAWPADYILNTSSNIANAVYDSLWYNEEIPLRKNLLYVLLRSNKPVIVNVPCVLPTLSLNYYATYLSTTFSYLTTMRAFFAEDGLQI